MWKRKLPKSIDEYKKLLEGKSPEEIISRIRIETGEHVEKAVMQETSKAILVTGRKARHLFERFFGRLVERGFRLIFVRRLREAIWVKGRIPGEVGVVVDCINSGTEIEELKEYLGDRNSKITKVYSFVVNTPGIKFLDREGTIGEKDVISRHKLSGKDFGDSFRRLQVYYQSRLEPMDVDFAYNMYTASPTISRNEFKRFIEKCCQKTFGNKQLTVQLDDDRLYLPRDTSSYTIEIADFKKNIKNMKLVDKVKPLTELTQLEYPQLRIKAKFEGLSLRFMAMSCCPPENFFPKTVGSKPKCKVRNIVKGCFLDVVHSTLGVERTRQLLCPQCVENNVSRIILDQLNQIIEKSIGKRQLSVDKINPVEFGETERR